jgi:hypothetical protein
MSCRYEIKIEVKGGFAFVKLAKTTEMDSCVPHSATYSMICKI